LYIAVGSPHGRLAGVVRVRGVAMGVSLVGALVVLAAL